VLFHLPGYPPVVNAGSEITVHAVARELRRRGHDARVLVAARGYPPMVDGVCLIEADQGLDAQQYRWADVVITQLSARNRAVRLAARFGRPVVQMLQMGGIDPKASFGRPHLTVFDAEWLRRQRPVRGPSMVLHPLVDRTEYETTPGDAITIVGMSEFKGVDTFYALAERLVERPFLAVQGSWGEQVMRHPGPQNVTVLTNTTAMRGIYARTRILIMPSRYETFGRVCIEAGLSGIPTIAHPSEGVREALGTAGLFADRDDVDAWEASVRRLDDPEAYRSQSVAVRERAEKWSSMSEFDAFEEHLIEVCARSRR
jgi:glycosyltransferase involved in cell wall biosynthesis